MNVINNFVSLLFGVFVLTAIGCKEQPIKSESFSLEAEVTDIKSGEAVLFLYNIETKAVDTVAYSKVNDGKFRFDSSRIAFEGPTKFSFVVKPTKEEQNGRGYSKSFVIFDNKPIKGRFGVWDKVSEVNGSKYHDRLIKIDNHHPILKLYRDSMDVYVKTYREDFTEKEKKDRLEEVQENIKNLNGKYKKHLTEVVYGQYQESDDIVYKGLLLEVYGHMIEAKDYVEYADSLLPQLKETSLTYKNLLFKKKENLNKLSVSVGQKVKDFTLNNLENIPINLEDILNKNEFVLLDFWASWCSPCRKDIPILKDIYTKFHNKGFEIFMVSIDTKKDKWIKASNEENLKWYSVLDNQKKIKEQYGVTFIPQNFLINKEKIIVGVNLREKDLENKLHELLKE